MTQKKNEIKLLARTWMELEIIMLKDIRNIQKDKESMFWLTPVIPATRETDLSPGKKS
jgi:hypothetical protein